MRRVLVILLWLCSLQLYAQTTLNGAVEDSVSHKRLSGASVMLLRRGRPVKFVRTDAQGSFQLRVPSVLPDDSLQVTTMGYEKRKVPISSDKMILIRLHEKAFELKEVSVQGSRVHGLRDTITYDLTRFATDRDNNLKDVLKRLPGVDVDKNGEIRINGQPITRFTVEGLDLTRGRYNLMTENLKAKDVKKAEIIEHDQPVKALQGKMLTDNVALNIGLKDGVRDKLLPTFTPYLQIGEPTHAGGSVNVMQVGKKRQLMYDAVYDRTGRDIEADNYAFYHGSRALVQGAIPKWQTVPTLSAPIEAERLRFNTSQRYSVNRVFKSVENQEFHVSAHYLRQVIRQRTENRSLYYLDGKVPEETDETGLFCLRGDQFNLNVDGELNNEKVYGHTNLTVGAAQADALSELSSSGHGATDERVRMPEVNVAGSIDRLYTLSNGTFSWQSVIDYHHARSDLFVGTDRTRLSSNLWHTRNVVSRLIRKRRFAYEYQGGFSAENLSTVGRNTLLSAFVQPSWRYEDVKWKLSYTQGIEFHRYFRQHQSFFLLNPTLYASLKQGTHTEWTATVSYHQQTGSWADFAVSSYRRDYRSRFVGADFVPLTRSLTGRISYDYKRAIREFFAYASLSGTRSWMDAATDMQISGGDYLYTLTRKNHQADRVSADAGISKGFYALHLKTALGLSASYLRGLQLSGGGMFSYSSRSLTVSPRLTFSPSWCQIAYDGSFVVSRSQAASVTLHTITDWCQRLTLTQTIGRVDLSVVGVHYHNELQASRPVNALIVDAGAVWRAGKARVELSLRNLLNKKEYAVTNYSGISSVADRYYLRPRELVAKVQWSL